MPRETGGGGGGGGAAGAELGLDAARIAACTARLAAAAPFDEGPELGGTAGGGGVPREGAGGGLGAAEGGGGGGAGGALGGAGGATAIDDGLRDPGGGGGFLPIGGGGPFIMDADENGRWTSLGFFLKFAIEG